MRIFKKAEKRLEGMVEGGFGRAFKSSVQPVELAHKLAKEMGDHKTVGVSNVYVPNEFDVYLGKEDFEHLISFEDSLKQELSNYVTAFARREEADDIVAENRRRKLMRRQARIVKALLDAKVGTATRVLLEAPPEEEGGLWEGRTEGQAPDDIDGATYVAGVPASAQPGDFADVRITGHGDYDLFADWRES